MNRIVIRSFLYSLSVLLLIFILWVITPRIWSALNPSKPPAGYYIMAPAYIALLTGVEKLVDTEPGLPAGVEAYRNIEYSNAGGNSLQLDVYKPSDIIEPAPLLVFIHGGGWKGGKREDYLVYLVDFAQRGYVTATVSYRLLADSPYPACAEDISEALKWFFAHGSEYGYDPDRIALIGGSAGAHLAMLAAYSWKSGESTDSTFPGCRIKAVVDIYGPADLTTEYARNHDLVTSFIARPYNESPELYVEASPVSWLDENDPPTLILHGTADRLVPVSQSDDLKARLDALGVPCRYYRLPGWPHTMDIVKRVNDYCKAVMSTFFAEYL